MVRLRLEKGLWVWKTSLVSRDLWGMLHSVVPHLEGFKPKLRTNSTNNQKLGLCSELILQNAVKWDKIRKHLKENRQEQSFKLITSGQSRRLISMDPQLIR